MQIAAHILAYNVNRFLRPVLENLEPHVDKIYIAHAERPFGYIEESRRTKKNPTTIEDLRAAASGSKKIEIISGDWLTDEAMRNDCLVKARADGFDWFIIQDADEFYTDASWKQIKRSLHQSKTDDHFTTTWYNFWKSSHYVLTSRTGSIKDINAGFAIRCSSDVKFVDRRSCNNQYLKIIDTPCYHYSYVMDDAEMLEKTTTWSHSHEVRSKAWYTYKWLNWNESSRWLNPVYPPTFSRAIRFPMEQPDFAEQFALPVNIQNGKVPSFSAIVGEAFYDASARLLIGKRALGPLVKSILPIK